MPRSSHIRRHWPVLVIVPGLVLALFAVTLTLPTGQASTVHAESGVTGDASPASPTTLPPEEEGAEVIGTAAGSLVRTVGALLLVIVVIYAGVFAARRWLQFGGGKSRSGGGHLELIESVYLGPKHRLSLVRMGEKTVLVGIAENGMTSLAEQPLADLQAHRPVAPVSTSATATDAPLSFNGWLQRALGHRSSTS